jgi:hypothetical protein
MLENKLGITDSTELARMEEKISKQKALEMFESGFFETLEPGTYKSLAMIHQYLFDEIYNFAGKLRKVNISKGNFRFAPLMYLETALQSIDKMPSTTSSFPFSSSSVLSSRLRISKARLFNKIPSSVSDIFFPFRINNVIPRSSSNAAICLDSVGWVICNCSAAFVKLCSFATVKK